ncbi:hypothetical protein COOONC_02461 [Cooperia oncophora]
MRIAFPDGPTSPEMETSEGGVVLDKKTLIIWSYVVLVPQQTLKYADIVKYHLEVYNSIPYPIGGRTDKINCSPAQDLLFGQVKLTTTALAAHEHVRRRTRRDNEEMRSRFVQPRKKNTIAKMKKFCVFCEERKDEKLLKYSSASKKQNCIMIASLSLMGYVEQSRIDGVVGKISTNNKLICHCHIVEAARYLTAEMAIVGKQLSYYQDPSAQGSTAYVNTMDIPPHLVEAINYISNNNYAITARDVGMYLNNALKKYHGTSFWPHYQEQQEEPMEEGGTHKELGNSTAPCEPPLNVDSSQETVDIEEWEDADDPASSVSGELFYT